MLLTGRNYTPLTVSCCSQMATVATACRGGVMRIYADLEIKDRVSERGS